MMSVSSRGRTTVASGPTAEFRIWALRSQLKHLLALLLFSLLGSAIALSGLGGWGAIVATLLVWLVSWQLWLPIRWQIGPRGIVQRLGFLCREVTWDRVADAEMRDNALVVCLAGTGGWAGYLRRLYIPCGEAKVAELYQTICYWKEMAQQGQAAVTGDSQPR